MYPQKTLITGPNFVFVIMMLMFTVELSHEQACNPEDAASLVAFSANLSNSTSSSPLNWSSSTSCCQWEGVECDPTGRVTTLKLVSRGLKGVINPSIGSLVSLTHLNLSKNYLLGSLLSLVSLINLQTMDLSVNTISGSIPPNIATLTSLKRLHLQFNNLSGPIPPTLITTCTGLVDIILASNRLEGDISILDFSKLVHLQKLDLLNNTFTGTLPESLYSCKSLTAIRVAANNLHGQISPKILELKSLSFLSLTENSFTNITSTLSILANCNNLTALFLGENFNGESLPSDTDFVGSSGFPQLQYLSFDGCNLTASFPEWLSKIKTLRALTLHGNKIRGQIPSWIADLQNLFFLDASSNLLFGEIPQELCQLPALISTRVAPKLNRFNLELPFYSHSRSRGVFEQYSIFAPSLSFSSNKISGHIPSEIGRLQGVQRIDFSSNRLSGNIPAAISNLMNLDTLKLSDNNLTGTIPASLTKLNFLAHLNLSYNNLEGPIPSGAQFNTFGTRSFIGNPRLCGDLIHVSCTYTTKPGDVQSLNTGQHKQTFIHGLYVGFASGFSGILVIVASYVWFTIRMK